MSDDDDTNLQVPDDLSGLDESTPGTWRIYERLELHDGTSMTAEVGRFPYEPHLGNVMQNAAFGAIQTLNQARKTGVLRFLAEDHSLFLTPIDNVRGIYIDVTDPDGEQIPGSSLKPGYRPDTDPS